MALRLTIRSPNGGSYSLTFDDPEVRVGRASFCAVRLPYPAVSSHHLTITEEHGTWFVRDVGSTNGSWFDGTLLPTDQALPIADGQVLEIGELGIEFAIIREYVEGFTLAETGTLLRKLVSETAAAAGAGEDAFFEVLEGPRLGTRYTVSDDIEEVWAGGGSGAELRIIGLEAQAFAIQRAGEGFRLLPGDVDVLVNDAPLGELGHILRSADQVLVGAVRLVWFDPLEPYLERMEREEDPEPESAESIAQPEPLSEDATPGVQELRAQDSNSLTLGEWLLLVISLGIAAAAVAAIVVIVRA